MKITSIGDVQTDSFVYGSCRHKFLERVFDHMGSVENLEEPVTCSSCGRSVYYFIPKTAVLKWSGKSIKMLVCENDTNRYQKMNEYNSKFGVSAMDAKETILQTLFWFSFLPIRTKCIMFLILVVALVYFFVDQDLIPDETPVIGYLDDLFVAVACAVAIVFVFRRVVVRTLKDVRADHTGVHGEMV